MERFSGGDCMWLLYSLGTRRTWSGSFAEYLRLEDALNARNVKLRDLEACIGMIAGFLVVSEPYQREIFMTIEDVLASGTLTPAIEENFLALREVFRESPVLMG